MVRKLFKHEFLAWLRVMPIIYGIALAVAGVGRLLQLFESDELYYVLIFGSAALLFGAAMLVCMVAPTIFGIVRFYKNLFTGEGYLSFTLPVSMASHLWVKLLTATTFSILSTLVCCLSVMLMTAGEALVEIGNAAAYLLNQIPAESVGSVIGYCAEVLTLMLLGTFSTHLFYASCICIGQLAKKNRILAAVGVYFGFYLISQFFGTVLGLFMMFLAPSIENFFAADPILSVHIVLGVMIALELVLSTVFMLICHGILRRRLNLE